jgi:hypothetical protein
MNSYEAFCDELSIPECLYRYTVYRFGLACRMIVDSQYDIFCFIASDSDTLDLCWHTLLVGEQLLT